MSDLIDDAWDLEEAIEDMPLAAYYNVDDEEAVPPEPPAPHVPQGAGGYAPFLLPREPRVYCYEMDVMAVASAGAGVFHRALPIPPTVIPPEIPVRPQPQVHLYIMDVALRAQAKAEYSVVSTPSTRGVESCVSASADLRHVDWLKDVIGPDDDEVITLL